MLYLTPTGELWVVFADHAGERHRRFYLSGGAVRAFEVEAGGQVVYVSEEGALWVDNLLGTSTLLLAERPPDGAEIDGLAVSPDGTQVAYVVKTPGADCMSTEFSDADGLWVVGTTGGPPRQLAQSHCREGDGGSFSVAFRSLPTWSPDGNRLLVPTSVSEGSYYGVLDLAEGTLRYPEPETLLGGEAAWSRDGRAIIGTDSRFLAPASLLLVDASTFEVALLLDGKALNVVTVAHYRRADGRIAFWMAEFEEPEGLAYDLYLGTWNEGAFTYEQAVKIGISRPWNVAWSADETAVAVELHATTNGEATSEVVLISLPPRQVIRLDGSQAPRWGP